MSEASTLAPGTLLAGKFRIERLLGAGAMGAVYAIRHELTRHQRALKLLHADVGMVPELVQRFLNEASAAGRAGNAHLVETFDAGTLPSGEAYVVMEMLEGETLTSVLEREGPLEPRDAAEYVAQAAEGIEAAHRAGIIHRDLKPDNLFVTKRGGAPFVKILDFGVSKFVTESGGHLSQTRAGVIYGSPAYMSPEQLTGSLDIDRRTDVFGLGVVLYQSLTGKLPFDAPTLQALSLRILTGDATPIESLRPDLPPALREVARRALAPDRDQRFSSALDLATALAPFRETAKTFDSLPPGRGAARSNAPSAGSKPGAALVVMLAVAAAVIVGVFAAVTLLRQPRSTAASERPAITPPATLASAPLTAPPAPDASAVLAAAESAKPSLKKLEIAQKHVTTASAPAAAAEPAPVAAPAAASAQPSTAESLGLRNDNPFR